MRLQDEIMPEVKDAMLSSWDVVYALNIAIACLIAYWIMTEVLSRFDDRPSDFSGGTWAAAATGHALASASARKVNGHDLALIALQTGGIEQKRYTEDSRSAHHGGAHVGAN